MTKGKLKRTLRKNRIKRNIEKALVYVGCAGAVTLAVVSISIRSNAETVSKATIDSEIHQKLSADVASAMIENLNYSVEENDNVIVSSSNPLTEECASETEAKTEDKPEEKPEDNREIIEPGTVLYVVTNLNVREKPDATSKRIDGYKKGDMVTVIEDDGDDWVTVEYKGKTGYVNVGYLDDEAPLISVSSTAYWDEYNRRSASGRQLKEHHSIAGMVRWLGRSVNIYKHNSDGSVGELLGTYTFDDTGYGASSGYGNSDILSGRAVGTIENGTCIDIYFDTEQECVDYGRRNVYIQFID